MCPGAAKLSMRSPGFVSTPNATAALLLSGRSSASVPLVSSSIGGRRAASLEPLRSPPTRCRKPRAVLPSARWASAPPGEAAGESAPGRSLRRPSGARPSVPPGDASDASPPARSFPRSSGSRALALPGDTSADDVAATDGVRPLAVVEPRRPDGVRSPADAFGATSSPNEATVGEPTRLRLEAARARPWGDTREGEAEAAVGETTLTSSSRVAYHWSKSRPKCLASKCSETTPP
mmetsp:Transcript_109559/g.316772  ORF Transcript_109559/g.316772 Transcript_109559/m.316772 type:complete len:235 (+) Transcript_109559:217-921(+)